MTLYAPFSGTVLSKNVIEGEMVKAGMEIIKMADLSTLWLKADIYESDLGKISIGSQAEVNFSYNTGKTYKGDIAFIYPTVNPTTRTVTVRIDLNNSKEELKPSMFGNVTIKGNNLGEVIAVPETAVLRSGKNNIVILSLGEGKFKPVDVKLGLYSEGYYQILSGLKLNDAIVSSGQFMIDSESSLRSAVKLFTSDNSIKAEKEVMSEEDMKNMNNNSDEMKDMNSESKEEETTVEHYSETSIIHTGIIDVESIDKNGDGKIQYVAGDALSSKKPVYTDVRGASGERMVSNFSDASNELYVDRDIMVLANPEIANLPNWVIALVAAGALAAALSTAAGLLLVISASVSHDLIKKMINPNITEKGELIAARLSAVVAVCVAGYFGINPPDFVAATVALAFGLAAASFFPAIILGIFDKRMNKEGAILGMIVGILLMLFYMLKFKFDWFGGGTKEDWWFGISPEGFGTVAMFVNFILSLIVSRFTNVPPKDVQEIVENIRIPSGAGEATH